METDEVQNPHQALLQELGSSDAQLAPTLRAVYDSGQSESFLKSIDKYTLKTDTGIEKLCNYHYQGFIEAVDELLKVRKDGEMLKNELKEIDHELLESGQGVLSLAEDLVAHRVMQRNIVASIEALNACLPVLQSYDKVTEHVAAKHYYQALRTLTKMQNQLKKVPGLGLTQLLADNIPTVRAQIQEAVKSDLQDWLEGIIAQATSMGQTVLRETSKIESCSSKTTEDYTVDYSPVYHCMHIYSVLDKRDEFAMFYVDSRKKQAVLALDCAGPSMLSISDPLERILHYFAQVVGFFIVEDHILNTTEQLVSASSVADLWKMALDRIGSVLSKELSACQEKTTFYKLKKIVVLFAVTLESYDYNTTRLYDLLLNVRDRYDQLLMAQWQKKFDMLLLEDSFLPVKIEESKQWDELMSQYSFTEHNLAGSEPMMLSYSISAPQLFKTVRDFYPASLIFVGDLNLSHNQVDEMIRGSGNRLIAKHMCQSLTAIITKTVKDKNVPTLMQIVANISFLQEILPQLDPYIAKLTNTVYSGVTAESHGASNQSGSDSGVSMLQEVKKRAEDCSSQLIRGFIDGHLGLAEYKWVTNAQETPASNDSLAAVPSPYIQGLVQHLTALFSNMDHLPRIVTTLTYFTTCEHLSDCLLSILTELPIRAKAQYPCIRPFPPTRITIEVFSSLDLDIMICEGFAVSCQVPHLKECFRQIHELVDLFKDDNYEEYLDKAIRQKRYSNIQVHNIFATMDRLLVDDGVRSFSKFFGGDKDRKKMEKFVQDLKFANIQPSI